MINWRVRVKNKNFWLAIIPAVLLLVQQVAGIFGFTLDVANVNDQLIALAGTVFTILAIFGVVQDPTTKGFKDSDLASTYDKPE